jgi:hypothetical protein
MNEHEYRLNDLAIPFPSDRMLNLIVNKPLCISANSQPISFEYTCFNIYAAPLLSQLSSPNSPLPKVSWPSSRWSGTTERTRTQKKKEPPTTHI